jgi:hypothetical protein
LIRLPNSAPDEPQREKQPYPVLGAADRISFAGEEILGRKYWAALATMFLHPISTSAGAIGRSWVFCTQISAQTATRSSVTPSAAPVARLTA